MLRNKEIQKIKETTDWDVIVIGGGASGLGSALDATTRGYKTLLLESHDFAKGTSSRSTKLVHGGVRYLAQGDVSLVREALRERGLLAQNAAHLVKNQSFVIPNYTWWGGPYYRFGLGMYDLLAAGLSLGKTKHINKEDTIKALPTIEPKDLHSGVVYKDGQFDDSRLAVNLAQTIVDEGGAVINYMKVIDLTKGENNQLTGVKAKDVLSGEEYELKAKAIINATGVFTNEVLNMDNPDHRKFVVPSQGIHLVLDRSFLPTDEALMIPKTSDGRVLFAVPWHDKVVVGTTDTLIEEPSFEPKALEKEIEFVLETARRFLTKKPTREDVKSVFAGLRPLAAPEKEGQSTKEVSRSHKVIVSDTGLITITGGKWTTYRQMAEDVIDKAIEEGQLEQRICVTTHMSIHGNMPQDQVDRDNHLYIYGSDIPVIEYLQKEKPEFKEKLHPDYDFTVGEVVWATREEMAIKVEDVLARRVRLLFLDARAAIDVAEKTAKIMAKELDKDEDWVKKETEEFISIAKNYLLVDYTPKEIQ
ncbi:FAD-dependent oxidoreductase [Flavobacteriaceae bacterium Ap0902]|nr:FAD-dependent oxidoreductase [Flavobacteriaceae bacterium Ap0902]